MDLYDMLGDVGGGFRRADKSRTRLTLNNMKDNPFGGLVEEIAQRQQPMVGLGPVTADFAIDRMRDAKTQLEQARAAARVNAARERLAMDRAKSRAMTGTYQNPELTRLGNAEQIAAAMERARGGAAPGQQVDPRWLLGGISVSGQGLTRGGGGAAPAPASMGREALMERLAQMAQSDKYGGQYTNFPKVESSQGGDPRAYRVVAGRPESMENRPPATFVTESSNGRGMALVGRLPQERLDAIAAQRAAALGKAGTKTLLEAARDKRREKNVTRMLSSRNPAVRERGMALMEAMRGPQQAGSGIDMAGIMAQAQRISNQYGPVAGRMALDSMLAGATAAADRAARAAELDKTLASNEKVAKDRAEADLKLATDPRVVFMQGLNKDLTPEQAMERVRAVQRLTGNAGAAGGLMLDEPPPRPTLGAVPRPFTSGGAPMAPAAPPGMPTAPSGVGRIVDEPYNSFWERVLGPHTPWRERSKGPMGGRYERLL